LTDEQGPAPEPASLANKAVNVRTLASTGAHLLFKVLDERGERDEARPASTGAYMVGRHVYFRLEVLCDLIQPNKGTIARYTVEVAVDFIDMCTAGLGRLEVQGSGLAGDELARRWRRSVCVTRKASCDT
jgi:hypothetical protein